jgi:hypothetical protein
MYALVKKSIYLTIKRGEIHPAKKDSGGYLLISPKKEWLFFFEEEVQILGVKHYYKIC